jgi:hypothetical protein
VTSYIPDEGTWLWFAHEMGHTFGGLHTFQDGVGTTGGILDYGDPYYDMTVQFNPANQPEICPYLTSLGNSCPYLTLDSSGGCGDGVLSPDEACEGLNLSSFAKVVIIASSLTPPLNVAHLSLLCGDLILLAWALSLLLLIFYPIHYVVWIRPTFSTPSAKEPMSVPMENV